MIYDIIFYAIWIITVLIACLSYWALVLLTKKLIDLSKSEKKIKENRVPVLDMIPQSKLSGKAKSSVSNSSNGYREYKELSDMQELSGFKVRNLE